jgi:predicted nucleic acid binding AN1-type Zn finger protein
MRTSLSSRGSDCCSYCTPHICLSHHLPGRTNIAAGHKVKGDHNAKVRLAPTLAPDEVSGWL